ncbi:hypothetical protein [Aliivibrio sifiae]|uniref:Uncharacterized protein n=1 Tax=Aliivibrio sifiae TaxID=566293 RepID=A0A2S7X163_9GAMM|nr:hypothetical protein [Aliivibrio sifiae]PQJ83563.1 hypothetical protein BTO23_20705 [Aliivibrio sifiae]GLR76802.1 hypothetical protein GCM10007855_36770 [Aliivibrio sifiae]
MNFTVPIAIVALILVGLLFGFTIQISSSILNVISSVGSAIGGMGAAIAAWFSYRAIAEWKHEFKYKIKYEYINEMESIFYKVWGDFSQIILTESVSSTDSENPLISNFDQYRERYEYCYSQLSPLMKDKEILENVSYIRITFNLISHYHIIRNSNWVMKSKAVWNNMDSAMEHVKLVESTLGLRKTYYDNFQRLKRSL